MKEWDIKVRLAPLQEELVKDVNAALWTLLLAVGLVLLLACLNVAGLLFAQGIGRFGEIAVRAALGAGRGRIVRQLLSESALLGLAGAAMGMMLAVWFVDILTAYAPQTTSGLSRIRPDARVLAFNAGLMSLTVILFGLLPALAASRIDLVAAWKSGTRGQLGPASRRRVFPMLIIGETALVFTLTFSAIYVLASFRNLTRDNLGFQTERIVTLNASLAGGSYFTAAQRRNFYERIVSEIAVIPGIDAASAVGSLPPRGGVMLSRFIPDGQPAPEMFQGADVIYNVVTPAYFQTLGVPLLEGRGFLPSDTTDAQRVVLVNEAFVRKHFPSDSPIGKRGRHTRQDNGMRYTIVGVVGDFKNQGLGAEVIPAVYLPLSQSDDVGRGINLAIRTSLPPGAVRAVVAERLRALDPTIPLSPARTMLEHLEEGVARPRFTSQILTAFALAALLLGAVGIYSVLANEVYSRIRDLGVRLALGAQGGDVFRAVLWRGLRLAGIGLLAGASGAWAASRWLESLMEGGQADQASVFVLAVAMLALLAGVAAALPALRAARVDPIRVLRYE